MVDDKDSSESKPENTPLVEENTQPEDTEKKQKVTKLILDQIKQLLELNNKLNEKIQEIENKVTSKKGGSNGLSEEVEERLSNVEKNMEKLLGLYELVTNQYNPFIAKPTTTNIPMDPKPPEFEKSEVINPGIKTEINVNSIEPKPNVINKIEENKKEITQPDENTGQPEEQTTTNIPKPETSLDVEKLKEIQASLQSESIPEKPSPDAVSMQAVEHKDGGHTFPMKEKVVNKIKDIPNFEENPTHQVIDCSKINTQDDEERLKEKLIIKDEVKKDTEKQDINNNVAEKRFQETINGNALLKLEQEFYEKVDDFIAKEDNKDNKKQVIGKIIGDFEQKLVTGLMDKLEKKSVVLDLIDPKYYFYFTNGLCARNLKELYNNIKGLDEDSFYKHVDENKNDFSNWVKEIIQNEKLSNNIKEMKNKDDIIKEIEKYI